MGRKLYVGNLNYRTTEDELRDAFGADGREVAEVAIILDRETGRPRGFGFVTMGSDEDAQKAIEALDGQMVGGRTLKVNESQDRRGPPRGRGGPGGRGPRPGGRFDGPRGGGFRDGPREGRGGGYRDRSGGGYGDRSGGGYRDRGDRPGGGGGYGDRGGRLRRPAAAAVTATAPAAAGAMATDPGVTTAIATIGRAGIATTRARVTDRFVRSPRTVRRLEGATGPQNGTVAVDAVVGEVTRAAGTSCPLDLCQKTFCAKAEIADESGARQRTRNAVATTTMMSGRAPRTIRRG